VHNVAHVIADDLDSLAQLRPGDPIRFRRLGVTEAREIDRRVLDRLAARSLRMRTLAAVRLAWRIGQGSW
jgi:allophanate hydrolase subunit 2